MTTVADEPITAEKVVRLLESRYPRPEWHTERELTLQNKRLDFVAFCLWGGNGRRYRVLGFEVKVSRGDWLRELKAIEKAQHWARVVDDFYVVAPAGVVPLEELPRGWGLLQVHGGSSGSLRLKAHPQTATPADTLPRELVARLLDRDARRSNPTYTAEIQRAPESAQREARAAVESELASLQEAANAHRRLLNATGLRHSDPERVLRDAAAIEKAWHALPVEWEFHRAVESARSLVEKSVKAITGLQEAIDVLQRAKAAAVPPPEQDPHA